MRRTVAIRIAALPLAAGLLIAVGAGPAGSSPQSPTPAVVPLDGSPSGSETTGHAEMHEGHAATSPSATSPVAPATSPALTEAGHTDHADHGDHDAHATPGDQDWTKVRPPSGTATGTPTEEDCGCGSEDHSSHGTTGEHDSHGTTGEHDSHGTAEGHGDGHGEATVAVPSEGTRTAVLGGFGAVNGAALVGAGLLRRRTKAKRGRHLAARAAARPAAAPSSAVRRDHDDETGDEQ